MFVGSEIDRTCEVLGLVGEGLEGLAVARPGPVLRELLPTTGLHKNYLWRDNQGKPSLLKLPVACLPLLLHPRTLLLI